MPTRADQLQAHQHASRRVVQALTSHDPDPTGPARPRPLVLFLVSVMIAAVTAVGILVYGTLTGQGSPTSLRDSSTVLIEKETGAQYVYTKSDDQLHPVLNFASGRLLTDGTGTAPTTVRRKRLAKLRQDSGLNIGAPLGIPDAPDALPGRGELLNDAWQVCTRTPAGGPGSAARTDLLIGDGAVSGGHVLVGHSPGGTAEAMLVQAPDDQTYLIYANHKFAVPNPAVVLSALGWTGQPRAQVGGAWLNALPAGSDVKALTVDGLGGRSSVVPQRIGRLLRTTGVGADQWALVRRDSVQPISDVQARLLQADQRTATGKPVTMSTAAYAALAFKDDPVAARDLPETVPALVPITATACARVRDAATGVDQVVVDPSTGTATAPATDDTTSGRAVADRVSVPFGRGVLVQARASATAPAGTGTVVIVTDSGIQYPIADSDARARLGYGDTTPQTMPAELVSLLPVGPALSTTAARAGAPA